jgi:hypothetical protein
LEILSNILRNISNQQNLEISKKLDEINQSLVLDEKLNTKADHYDKMKNKNKENILSKIPKSKDPIIQLEETMKQNFHRLYSTLEKEKKEREKI